jgi:hypothetical protein
MTKLAELEFKGRELFSTSRMPEVEVVGDVIVVTFVDGAMLRLAPNLCMEISSAWGQWQYDVYS